MRGVVTFLLVAGLSAPALAVPINYGDYTAITVIYRDVTEEALTAFDGPALFGAPTLSGDALDFNPVGFSAFASGIAGADDTDGKLEMMIEAKPTKVIEFVEFSEAGEFDLLAAFGFEANEAFASVTADVDIEIIEVDGIGVAPIIGAFAMTFTENGDWSLSVDGGGIPKQAVGDWTGALSVDLKQLMVDEGVVFASGATKVNVTLTNELTATSNEGTSAFIAKKDFDGLSITAMPEPGLGWLIGLSLAALAGTRRRAS